MRRPTALPVLLLVGAIGAVGAACSSGAKSTAASPTSITPSTSGSASSAPGCHGAVPGAGGQGSGDVLVPGDIPDTQAYVTYQSPTDGYRIDTPEGWARRQAGPAVTFGDKFNAIRVELTSAPSAPTVASAQSADVALLASTVPCFQAGKVSQVSRKSGPAVVITYRADSAPDPVTNKVVRLDVERYQFWHAGRTATITLSSPQGSDNVDPWRRVTDSFAWTA
jgi:hypothetical protein